MRSIPELLQGISVGVPAGQLLPSVMIGDTVRVHASIDYRGSALSDTFYAAIGNRFVYFDEIWYGTSSVKFVESADWRTYEMSADITITEIGLAPWTPGIFDLYVKLDGYPAAGKPELSNVIEILLKPDFRNFAIASYEVV
ncbi:unnamed protein product [marine sediment metagenome]|uniref:Uncharacterized protein n=1 Tax=marine sediment metagenome TaxID=412755 RepID=X1U1H0_9ZZZZ